MRLGILSIGLALLLPNAWVTQSTAQSIGYAEAADRVGAACGQDIAKYCKQFDLGGGKVQQCLDQNRAQVSPACTATVNDLRVLLAKRAEARGAAPHICDVDLKRLCAGVQQGDGNLLECYYKVRKNVSAQCQKVMADAGYEVSLAPASSGSGRIGLSAGDLVNSLQGVEESVSVLSAANLRQLAVQGVRDPSRQSRVNREPLSEQLNKLAQLNIAIQFDFNSSRIRPDSFRAIGLIADALYHPYLQGYRFLIIGHTDAKGDREYNLRLSQQRADAVRDALINPFGIAPSRIEAVGLGEEQLLNAANPEAPENRRVQLINVGQ